MIRKLLAGLLRQPKAMALPHNDDLLTFWGVHQHEFSHDGDSVYIKGLPMRSDARYQCGAWLPREHVIINYRGLDCCAIMPRWRAFHSAINEDAAHTVQHLPQR